MTTYGIYAEADSTGSPFGVYGALAGAGNQGYAGYFDNTGGGSSWDVGVEGGTYNTGAGYAVIGEENGAANTGYAGYFQNTATSGVNYGVYALNNSASGWAVYSAGTSPNYFAGLSVSTARHRSNWM